MPQANEMSLVLALADIAGFAETCRDRDDRETYRILDAFYHLADATIAPADGTLVKTMGDAILMVFPADEASDAITCLHALQHQAAKLWGEGEQDCQVRVRAHLGTVVAGPIGPHGRFDVVGEAVNELFRMSWDGPEASAAFAANLRGENEAAKA